MLAIAIAIASAFLAGVNVHRIGSTDGLGGVGRAIATVIKALRASGP